MGEQTTRILVTVLTIVVLIFVVLVIPRLMLKRAVRKVVARFRKQGAISPETALTLRELGLLERPFERVLRLRNYRPYAGRLLGQAKVLKATEDGRVYLSEDELERSPVKAFAKIV
jgi:ABC-type dipeptide/oligopeptide/nickel transport system permease component